MALAPGHQGPNLERSSAGQDGFPAAKGEEAPLTHPKLQDAECHMNAEDAHL